MAKKDCYRAVYSDFKELCRQGKQPCSFLSYCKERGVSYTNLRKTLKKEYGSVKGMAGYTPQRCSSREKEYLEVYENFKGWCESGNQSCSFRSYCEGLGLSYRSVATFLSRKGLGIKDLPGYVHIHRYPSTQRRKYQEVPFEDVIFQEAGFVPAEGGNKITIMVNDQVSVSFPADTDIEKIAKFVKKLGKEVSHVGS